jgi:N6-L-threonylcarbamoyladenine synthase
MIHSDNLNFSFSGLKTAVLYYIRDNWGKDNPLLDLDKMDIAREFEDAVVDVLLGKTKKALDQTRAQTLIIAGGVVANKKIRSVFVELEKEYGGLTIKIPTNALATDNSLMIACATYFNIIIHPEILTNSEKIVASGNLRLK